MAEHEPLSIVLARSKTQKDMPATHIIRGINPDDHDELIWMDVTGTRIPDDDIDILKTVFTAPSEV